MPEILPATNVHIVHLLREPRAWVQAHLNPTGRYSWRGKISSLYRRATMFSRKGYFNNYHYEDIVTKALEDCHEIWRFVSISPDVLRHQPAYIKLLAFWWCANLTQFSKLRSDGRPWQLVTLNE
jgi:hypothetical protein